MSHSKKYKHILICCGLILLYLSPYLVFGQNSKIVVHDNLDSNVVWNKVLNVSHSQFASSTTPILQIMGGLPRLALGTEFSYIVLLFGLFTPFVAYVINQFIVHFVAWVGACLFLQAHVFKQDEQSQKYAVYLALTFALLPFWPMGGLSIASLPLVAYVLLNLRKGEKSIGHYAVLVFIPFTASFVLSYFFFLILFGFVLLCDLFKKRARWPFFLGLVVLSLFFVGVEYRLFYSFFVKSAFVMQRADFASETMSLVQCIKAAVINFGFGQYHAHSLHYWVFPLLLILFVKQKRLFSKDQDKLFGLLASVLAISCLYGFYNSSLMMSVKMYLPILQAFNFKRFHWLHPFLWLWIGALIFKYLHQTAPDLTKKIFLIFCILQIGNLFLYQEHISLALGVNQSRNKSGNDPSFKQFYDVQLFAEIKNDLPPLDTFRMISVGMHPAVALYNGFYTFDSYQPLYPIDHKRTFRKIIAKELEKNLELKTYFDNWGSRCYAVSAELGKNSLIDKTSGQIIQNLEFDSAELKKNNIKYVFSSVPIANSESLQWAFIKSYEHLDSFWKIHVYKVF